MESNFLSQLRDTKDKNKTYYFMAGLPRSGSSLLSSILNQNPKIYSGPSSPVLSTMYVIENHLSTSELFVANPKPEQANLIISKVIDHFYADINKPIVIDKNRAWTSRVPYIQGYIKQKAKIICPVRDIDEILTSMITLIRRNPYKEGQSRINFIDEQLVKLNIPISDDNRCEYIASSQGILGQSLNSINDCFEQNFGDSVHFVEYKDLIKNPKQTIKKLYDFLGEPLFDHTFDDLYVENSENDLKTYGLADMHKVRKEIKNIASKPEDILSENILNKCKGMDFWRQESLKVNIVSP